MNADFLPDEVKILWTSTIGEGAVKFYWNCVDSINGSPQNLEVKL